MTSKRLNILAWALQILAALIVTMVCAGFTDVFIFKHAPALAIILLVALSVVLWIRRAGLGGRAASATVLS